MDEISLKFEVQIASENFENVILLRIASKCILAFEMASKVNDPTFSD